MNCRGSKIGESRCILDGGTLGKETNFVGVTFSFFGLHVYIKPLNFRMVKNHLSFQTDWNWQNLTEIISN